MHDNGTGSGSGQVPIDQEPKNQNLQNSISLQRSQGLLEIASRARLVMDYKSEEATALCLTQSLSGTNQPCGEWEPRLQVIVLGCDNVAVWYGLWHEARIPGDANVWEYVIVDLIWPIISLSTI